MIKGKGQYIDHIYVASIFSTVFSLPCGKGGGKGGGTQLQPSLLLHSEKICSILALPVLGAMHMP